MVLQEFPEIVARYKSRFYAMAWRFTGNAQDAEDLCQEIFLQVFRNLASFRGQSQLSTWLYRVALNRCLSYRRNAGRRPPVAPDATALSFMTDPGPTPEELAQVAVFQEFLPRQLTPEELTAEVKALIAEVGATSMKEMGKVMGVASKRLAGRADGKDISAKVKELLA